MKKSSILFLQTVIVLLGIVAAVLLLIGPWKEGVNANATTISEIYFDDPFLMLVYAGSIPFFFALVKAIKLLGYTRKNKVFSPESVKAVRAIKYCALSIIGFVAAEEIFIIRNHASDDIAGGFMMGVFITFGSIIIATASALFEKVLQNAVDLKTENELTV